MKALGAPRRGTSQELLYLITVFLYGFLFMSYVVHSPKHGSQLTADPAHAAVMADMSKMMQDPEAMQTWMKNKEAEFNTVPEDSN